MEPQGLSTPVIVALMGISVPLVIAVIHAAFKIGALSARVVSLETWRTGMRNDMHEVSDKLTDVVTKLEGLKTLVEERTERRTEKRELIS
jgi:hypothetical protein